MFEKNSVLTLSDNIEYVVVDKYKDKEITYVYLVDINNNENIIFGKLENGEIVKITDMDELEKIIRRIDSNITSNNQ